MRVAHRLKLSARNLGCTSLAEAAEPLEAFGRSGTLKGSKLPVERLARAFDRTAAALRIELDPA